MFYLPTGLSNVWFFFFNPKSIFSSYTVSFYSCLYRVYSFTCSSVITKNKLSVFTLLSSVNELHSLFTLHIQQLHNLQFVFQDQWKLLQHVLYLLVFLWRRWIIQQLKNTYMNLFCPSFGDKNNAAVIITDIMGGQWVKHYGVHVFPDDMYLQVLRLGDSDGLHSDGG